VPKPTGAEERGRCAALTRGGIPCRNAVRPGETLCGTHAPAKGEKSGALYDDAIGEEERRLWDRISVTDLDAEIRIAKLQLKRLLAAQQRAELDRRSKAGKASGAQRKRGKGMKSGAARPIDHDERVNRLLGRISHLVATRAKLQREAAAKDRDRAREGADDPVERLARKLDRVAVRLAGKAGCGKSGPSGSA
jgi:hypothetical protein